jgi:NADH-quinone oxidoreductase subunit J
MALFFLSLLLPLLGLLVLGSKNPVHSVLFLVLVFLNAAAFLVLLGVEFLAMLFLVVYVGAVAVLFLFVVMMLNLKVEGFRQSLLNHYPVSLGLLLGLVFLAVPLVPALPLPTTAPLVPWDGVLQWRENLPLLGYHLYTYQFFPLLLASLLLLVAMIGSILLTFLPSEEPSGRRQSIYRQVIRSSSIRSFP